MRKELTIRGEALGASQEGTLAVEQFLRDNYLFRFNVLSGKVEYVTLPAGEKPDYHVLTQRALNSIIIRAKREQICESGSPKADIVELVQSDEVESFNPIGDYLEHLPQWDGQNHVARLFGRLPGVSSEQLDFLSVWLRSAVAHWLQMDTLHGNECVPTLIGAQGCGKTTFVGRLLPPELREYFLDHLNPGEIDYQQLYAQVLHEIRELKSPYWFNNEQVARIQELNLNYLEQKDIAEVIEVCIRKPKDGEQGIRMKSGEIVELVRREYPSIKNNHSTKIHLGMAMKELGFEGKSHGNQTYYRVIPLKAA